MIPGFLMVGALILMVLLHEFGHCLACRWVGGQANEILMWPLGGLAYTQPPNTWQANLVTTVGGPMVNVMFLIVTMPVLWMITGDFWGVSAPNPFDMRGMQQLEVSKSTLRQALFALNYVNAVLLLFNIVPMFPLDGGRVLQELLWARLGYSRSMRIAVRVGYFGAIAMGLVGLIVPSYWLVAVAFFGGITCYITYKQLQWTDDMMGFESDDFALSLHQEQSTGKDATEGKLTRAERKAQQQARKEQDDAAEVDRILQKIASKGLESLNRTERKALQTATDRKRQEESS
jgi:Zn-dependent protease